MNVTDKLRIENEKRGYRREQVLRNDWGVFSDFFTSHYLIWDADLRRLPIPAPLIHWMIFRVTGDLEELVAIDEALGSTYDAWCCAARAASREDAAAGEQWDVVKATCGKWGQQECYDSMRSSAEWAHAKKNQLRSQMVDAAWETVTPLLTEWTAADHSEEASAFRRSLPNRFQQ